MRLLFVHQNFPAQFRYLAPAMAARGAEVVALASMPSAIPAGVRGITVAPRCAVGANHPWARDIEQAVIHGESTAYAAEVLKREGFTPDAIIAHPGWGEAMFLRHVWPDVPMGLYCEYFYRTEGADHDFDPEFPAFGDRLEMLSLTRLRGFAQRESIEGAVAGIAPTAFQASTFPAPFRDRITVVHDGIDTALVAPDPAAEIQLSKGLRLTRADEVITFVARDLEPYRGYHIFMRALPELLRRRSNAHVLIVGGDGTSYGTRPPEGQSWKRMFLDEVRGRIDRARVHFVGQLPYHQFLRVLRVSRLHVYLTYPFVLSWSLTEAMAAGAPVLASATPPVLDMIAEGETGLTFPFFDTAALIEQADRMLSDAALRDRLTANARRFAIEHLDLETVCLPRQIQWVESLVAG